MSARWYIWLLVLVPALLGFASLTLEVRDMRSSGFVAGVALSIGGLAILVLRRGRWRTVRGVRRVVALVPAVALGVVAALGLLVGVPEFVQVSSGGSWTNTCTALGRSWCATARSSSSATNARER